MVILLAWFIVPVGAVSGAVLGVLIERKGQSPAVRALLGAVATFMVLLLAAGAVSFLGITIDLTILGPYAAVIAGLYSYWQMRRLARGSA
jgi:hypothetical protein